MNYEKLDNDELLRLALDAMNNGRDADSLVMLKTLLERDPRHFYAQYLLAAQHAQLGMFDRAEEGFRKVAAEAPDFVMGRFQFGQLLVTRGAADEARQVLKPLMGQDDAVGAYARALMHAAGEDAFAAVKELEAGLLLPQEIPALAADMQRLRDQFLQLLESSGAPVPAPAGAAPAPIFLTGYSREG